MPLWPYGSMEVCKPHSSCSVLITKREVDVINVFSLVMQVLSIPYRTIALEEFFLYLS